MIGLGTAINVAGVLAGGAIGIVFGKALSERYQQTLNGAVALCCIFVGLGGCLEEMMKIVSGSPKMNGTMMMICSYALGALAGEFLNLEAKIEQFGTWLRAKTGNASDPRFVDGFVTTSLTICIGAMAVVGSIQDGMLGSYATLTAKAVMDLIIVMILSASLGKGCIFSAIPLAIFQGSITLLARFIEPLMTPQALSNLSLTGSMMITCVGINLIWGPKFRVANLLPTLVFAVAWAFLF